MNLEQWAEWLEKKSYGNITLSLCVDDARQIAKLARAAAILTGALKDGGYDLSPCGCCGKPVVCIPDGLPMCKGCAEKEAAKQ